MKLKNKIKMVFFDIDDTLRVKDTEYMPPSVNEAVAKLHEKGIKIGIASGRAIYGFAPEIMGLNPDYFVTINGQYVMNKDKQEIFSNPIATSDITMFVDWCKEHNLPYGMVAAEACAVSDWTPLVADAMTVIYGKIQEKPDFYKQQEVYQLWSYSENQIENTLPEEVKAHLKVVRWHEHSCDLFPMSGSKAHGIEAALNDLGITKDEIIVFGDGLNDLEMFQYAGFSVAMGNAHEDLKPHADYITKDILDDGILYALTELGIIE